MQTLTIGQVAARSGAATSALRYYESIGLISSTRSSGGQRRYARDVLRRVAVVRAGQRAGLPLSDIRAAFADLPPEAAPTVRDWARISRTWRAHLDRRISELALVRDELDACIGCGCLSLRRCALYNPRDEAAAAGPGSRLLREG